MKKYTKLMILGLCISALPLVSNNTVTASAADDTVIEAFAHYEFNDAENPGKDSSKNGFDLKKQSTSGNADALKMLKDGEDGYVSITRDQYADGGKSKGTGAYLYAPQQGNSKYDFSDMVTGSYTVSFTFRSDNSIGWGDNYSLTFGRYGSCLTIVPWANNIEIQLNNLVFADGATQDEKQQFNEANRRNYNVPTLDWTNVTVTANADDNSYVVYINGKIVETVTLPGVRLTASDYEDYTLAIGAQCNIYGNSATQFGNVDVKDLQIYDCALSTENVAKIIAGEKATVALQGDAVYLESISELDPTTVDLEITDVNTVNALIEGGLPAKVKAKTSNGPERTHNVYWFPAENQTIKGYLQTGAINPSQEMIELTYKYVCKFDYDEDLVTIENVQLDGVEYVPGTEITPNKKLLSFKLTPKAGATINSVSYLGMEWAEEDGEAGVYYIDVAEGALISIDAEKARFTVTYMDGDNELGDSKYTANGNEALESFDKEGYTFEGWYTDKELTNKFTSLDYTNPVNITLYAKYVEISTNEPGDNSSSGCGGSLATSFFGLLTIAGALLLSKKRK